ncbi:MAG: CerR family C-terminal domain-containing protein, partial [Sphingobium sp.]
MMKLDHAADSGAIIIREQQHPTEAFERLYQGMMRNVVDTMLGLMAVARPDLDERGR